MWTWAVGFNHPARATYHGSGNMGCWTIKDLYTVNHKEDKGHSQSSAHVNLQRLWASWRRRWHPTPVLLPGKSHGRRSLVGCSPRDRKELGTTERLHFRFSFHALEKTMATDSSVLSWRIPGTAEPGGRPSMGSHRVGHDWSDLAAAAAWTSSEVYIFVRSTCVSVHTHGRV